MTSRFLIPVVLLISSTCLAGAAKERDRDWDKNHPRRHEVNKRLNNQNRRIDEGEKNGKLSQGQANQLHAEDASIRQQERSDAAEHGGHITKGEQRQLNHEENQESKQIYDEKHP